MSDNKRKQLDIFNNLIKEVELKAKSFYENKDNDLDQRIEVVSKYGKSVHFLEYLKNSKNDLFKTVVLFYTYNIHIDSEVDFSLLRDNYKEIITYSEIVCEEKDDGTVFCKIKERDEPLSQEKVSIIIKNIEISMLEEGLKEVYCMF